MRRLLTFFTLFFAQVVATDYQPWTKVDLELYPRIEYIYQHYNKIQSSLGSLYRTGNDHILGVGLYGCFSNYSLELEGAIARTRDLNCGLDQFKLTGKYQYLNDIVGDCISMTLGASLIAASRDAVEQYGLFHHAKLEGELFVSVGEERTCLNKWASRWWAVGGIGLGERGSPWTFAQIAWEKNVLFTWHWRLFADLLWGFGSRGIDFSRQFHGYGSIKHRSIDVGTGAYFSTLCQGDFFIEFKQRVWAHNYPSCAQIIELRYIYPFGL